MTYAQSAKANHVAYSSE